MPIPLPNVLATTSAPACARVMTFMRSSMVYNARLSDKTIIMVTHDIDEVQLMNGHLLIMKGLNTNDDNDKE